MAAPQTLLMSTAQRRKKPVMVHGRKTGMDAINFEERMRMSYFQRQYVRKAMESHHRIIKNAVTKVDCKLDAAHDRVATHHYLNRRKLMTDRRRRADEPYSLAASMSHNTLHEWRLCMRAHETRRATIKSAIDVVVPRHVHDYRKVRESRRERAKLIDRPPPPRASIKLLHAKTDDDYHAEIMAAWDGIAKDPHGRDDDDDGSAARASRGRGDDAFYPNPPPSAARWRVHDAEDILDDEEVMPEWRPPSPSPPPPAWSPPASASPAYSERRRSDSEAATPPRPTPALSATTAGGHRRSERRRPKPEMYMTV